jgi:hypothetical protein
MSVLPSHEASRDGITPAAALLACLALVRSCAGQGRRRAPTSDYADYRVTRVAPTLPERLQAASRYLDGHPDGAFREEVAAWFAKIEPVFFDAMGDSLAGTEKYLATLPRGPHANSAEQRRDAFRAALRVNSGERIAEQGAEFERRLAAAARARDEVLTAYTTWIGLALDFDAWGRPLSEAKDPFSTRGSPIPSRSARPTAAPSC